MAAIAIGHPMETEQKRDGVAIPETSSGSTGGGSGSGPATITANDFLTLLVTELQNQDPTATTDPNEYINQLVNVNSLEQLISINQTLQSATSATGGSTPKGHLIHGTGATSPVNAGLDGTNQISTSTGMSVAQTANSSIATAGNLGIPKPSAAAERVAHALTIARGTAR